MSWIVQNLWNNREKIKGKSHRDYGIAYNFQTLYGAEGFLDDSTARYDDPFIENDEFNDLLAIEVAIDELKQLNLLSSDDLEILYGEKSAYPTKKKREVFSRKFSYICQRIAYYLGGYFTDEGYLSYITKKYKLTPEQQDTARLYIKSEFKDKILSKGYKSKIKHEKIRFVSAEV